MGEELRFCKNDCPVYHERGSNQGKCHYKREPETVQTGSYCKYGLEKYVPEFEKAELT